MTIYFNRRGIWVQHIPKIRSYMWFFFSIASELITSWIIWVNLFKLYVVRHNGITQRPHNHLFQKWVYLGATYPKLDESITPDKFGFFFIYRIQIHYHVQSGNTGQFVRTVCSSS